MAITGLVQITPVVEGMDEVILDCENTGLKKPLAECNNKVLGRLGEELAALYLESTGMEILEQNWSCSFGEVDIIGEEDKTLVLVEVKTRVTDPSNSEIAPELAVDYRKQNRYRKLALIYLAKQSRLESVRFDVVAVKLVGQKRARLRHYTGAYEWDD